MKNVSRFLVEKLRRVEEKEVKIYVPSQLTIEITDVDDIYVSFIIYQGVHNDPIKTIYDGTCRIGDGITIDNMLLGLNVKLL